MTDDDSFEAFDGGRVRRMSSEQTDIAVAVHTAAGVVIWTDEARANSGFSSSVTKHLFGFDIDIAVLIAPSRSPREADMVLDRLRQVATKIGACDAVTWVDRGGAVMSRVIVGASP